MSGRISVPPFTARLRAWNHLYGGDAEIVTKAAEQIDTLAEALERIATFRTLTNPLDYQAVARAALAEVFDPTLARNAMAQEKRLLDLLSFVPGWVVMKRAEVDRLLNEAEALRIERDDARAALAGVAPPEEKT